MPKRRGNRKILEEPKALVKNATDEKQIQDAKNVEKNDRERELEDLRDLMASVQGRRFFVRYMQLCGIHRTSVTTDCSANRTFFLEGQRNIGLQLLSDLLESDPVICSDILLKSKEGK